MRSWAGSVEADPGARLCVKGVDSESSQGRQVEEAWGSGSGKGRRPGQGEASGKNPSHQGWLLGSQCAHRRAGGQRARGGGAGASSHCIKRADCVLPNSMLSDCHVGVFTPWESANATNQDSFFGELRIYQPGWTSDNVWRRHTQQTFTE